MKTLICFVLIFLLSAGLLSQNSDWTYRNPNPQTDFNSVKFFNVYTGYICGAGGTILKTTNACSTFEQQVAGTAGNLYSLYFLNDQTGFACGDNSYIIYTSNGGTNWSVKSQGLSSSSLRSITFFNSATGYSCGSSGLLVKTTNGGVSWSLLPQITNLNLNEVYFLNESKGFLCADSGKIFVTGNGGLNWTAQNAGLNYQNVMCVDFVDSLKGFIGMSSLSSGANTNLYKTTNGGTTWENVFLTMVIVSFTDIKFINNSTGFVCSDNGPVMVTTNSGSNWWRYGLPPTTVMKSISKLDTSVIICGTNGWISKAGPSGAIDVIGGSKKNFISVSFVNENTGICIGDYQVNRTSNSGLKWNIQMQGNYGWFEGNTYLIKSFAFPSGNMYVVSHSYIPTYFSHEGISKSTDGGATWGNGYSSPGYFKGLDEKEGVAYLTHTSSVFKSTGGSFTQLYYVAGSTLGDVSFFNANTGLVISNLNAGSNGLLRTTNGGVNWVFNANQGNVYLYSIDLLPSGTGYASGEGAGYLIKTTNFGTSWQVLNTGLNQSIGDLKFIDDNNGWINLNYRLYFTKNGGMNFYPITSLENFNVRSSSFINSNTGFVCGDSGKVLKTTNGGLTFVSHDPVFTPQKFSISQNYPNPFNPVTNIGFRIAESGLVKLTIYDILGKEIAILVNEEMQPGSYFATWDASSYPSGVYFYKLQSGDFVESKKMILLK